MQSALARIPPGVQTFFDQAVRVRRHALAAIHSVFQGWSYDEIWLPAFDYLDLFAHGMGAWVPEKTYRFFDRQGHLLALRPDFTSLVARTVATRFGGRSRPIRLCYGGEVFRYDEPRHGRRDEFHQVGIEHLGNAGLSADLEVLVVACEALRAAGVLRPTVALSHAGFHSAMLAGLDAGDRVTVRDLLARRSRDGLVAVLAGMGLGGDPLEQVPLLTGPDALSAARRLAGARGALALAALDDLEALSTALSGLGLNADVLPDLAEVPALAYYTGLTFRVFAAGATTEIASGGRYDDLLASLGAPEPAVGMVFFLDSVLQASALLPPAEESAVAVRGSADLASPFAAALAARGRGERIRMEWPGG